MQRLLASPNKHKQFTILEKRHPKYLFKIFHVVILHLQYEQINSKERTLYTSFELEYNSYTKEKD